MWNFLWLSCILTGIQSWREWTQSRKHRFLTLPAIYGATVPHTFRLHWWGSCCLTRCIVQWTFFWSEKKVSEVNKAFCRRLIRQHAYQIIYTAYFLLIMRLFIRRLKNILTCTGSYHLVSRAYRVVNQVIPRRMRNLLGLSTRPIQVTWRCSFSHGV